MMKLVVLIVLQCTLCLSIRVPVNWNDDSEINNKEQLTSANKEDHNQKSIPEEYFKYSATKPQFAVDIATFHGVQSPEKHYSSYPVNPYTGVENPSLGHHHLLDPVRSKYIPYQGFINKSQSLHYIKPTSTTFDIYHPYKAEEPALQQLYKDPILDKIRNDLRDSKNRLNKYENEAGEADIEKDEYLESPDQIDNKHKAHKNVPAQFEIHRPFRQPIYYRPPPRSHFRENILNHKFKHPLNQNFVKVTPMHYRPVKKHLQRLRQQHAIKYEDERNEYPQLPPPESYAEQPDGYDIYEKSKAKFVTLRNNVDESINKAAQESKPQGNYELEVQDDDKYEAYSNDPQEEEFVPIKNYAQVRKTETTKHHPREKAFEDAESFDELKNAPRLREAIKSTKAQIVYSEEGYEDSAYDHAGEQKHASDHEGHGGRLKENKLSRGKYKIPSVSASYDDAKGSEYRDKVLHGEKWKNDDKNTQDETDSEDYSENEQENSENSDIYPDNTVVSIVKIKNTSLPSERRNDDPENSSISETQGFNNVKGHRSHQQHELNKRETSFVVPEINVNSTFLTEEQILNIKNSQLVKNKSDDNIKVKYPYYFQRYSSVNKDSPLQYAENLINIPKKTPGGTEFYDSRSMVVCSDVEDDIDPVPEKLKTGENPEDNTETMTQPKETQRLKGLGDKIDCFKAKYFGQNPLDSPFFSEEIISNPTPVVIPNLNELSTKFVNKNLRKFQPSLRKKRASASFIYEPYKIIREGQLPDSKKTTTTSNISPLIKQLQSSRVIDRTNSKHITDQVVKRNSNSKTYKDIDKDNRRKIDNNESNFGDLTFEDVSIDHRRGEPRYELKHQNHKPFYTPVENKTTITLQDYKEKVESKSPNRRQNRESKKNNVVLSKSNHHDLRRFTARGSERLNDPVDPQTIAASNSVSKIIRTTTQQPSKIKTEPTPIRTTKDEDEEYDEYEDDSDEEDDKYERTTIATTTTTIKKPIPRTKIATTTQRVKLITDKSIELDEIDYDDIQNKPKLQLVTRFRDPAKISNHESDTSVSKLNNGNVSESPKVREKKKKVTKSTLVTDTKSYGEDNEDMRKEDIDAMIGVKTAIDEYMPSYEKDNKKIKEDRSHSEEDFDEYGDDSEIEEDDDDDDYDDEENDKDDSHSGESDSEEDDDESVSDEIYVTTPEPTKRTLSKTTEQSSPTAQTIKVKIESAPKVLKKQIEIHKELLVNKSSPNMTQYKQDIKEVEITKETPPHSRRKNKKNVQVLDLYKDINLAKDINKLGGVEIFKEKLDLKSGPRHGGNYRSIKSENLINEQTKASDNKFSKTNNRSDVEASQSKINKQVNVENILPSKVRDINNSQNAKKIKLNDNIRNSKLIELSDQVSEEPIHGGNLRSSRNRGNIRNNKNAKFIELDDEDNEETTRTHGGNFKSYGTGKNSMHGGNYKSAKIVQSEDNQGSPAEQVNKNKHETSNYDKKNNAVVLLNGYARAVPILTTTPVYILDPSKRKYYYVDA